MSEYAIRLQLLYVECLARGFDHLAAAAAELLRREVAR